MAERMTIHRGSGLTVGIPERYLPVLRAAQLETLSEGRYHSTRYLVAGRILERLQAIGYAEGLELDSLFTAYHRYVPSAMVPLHSRNLRQTGGTQSVVLPPEVATWVGAYCDDYGLPNRSRAVVQLLSLDEFDDDRGRFDLSRITTCVPNALAPHVARWQAESRKNGRTVAISSLLVSQLCAAMTDLGIPYQLPRDYRIRWRQHPSDVEELVAGGKLQASIPRMLRESLARAREILRGRSEVSASEWFGETIIRLLWSRVSRGLPAEILESRPGGPKTIVLHPRRAVASGVGPEVYVERFLTLCKERAARDAWHARGGTGSAPPSTVDDHLGRTIFGPDAHRVAVDRGMTSTDGNRVRSQSKRNGGTGSHLTW